jgi:hypothetical protein
VGTGILLFVGLSEQLPRSRRGRATEKAAAKPPNRQTTKPPNFLHGGDTCTHLLRNVQLMLRRRLSVPQHSLLVSTWPANSVLTLHLRAILRLPGELRPRALQSFCSLAYHHQAHQLGDNSPTRDSAYFSFTPSQQFSYGGLLGSSASAANRELGRSGIAIRVNNLFSEKKMQS